MRRELTYLSAMLAVAALPLGAAISGCGSDSAGLDLDVPDASPDALPDGGGSSSTSSGGSSSSSSGGSSSSSGGSTSSSSGGSSSSSGGTDGGGGDAGDAGSLPTLSINDVTANEGNAGTTTATLTVTLSAARTTPVTVQWATANGTATAGSDYVARSGTLTFAPGTTTQSITVSITGDTAVEPNETLQVNLSAPNGATIGDGQGTVTITDDDQVGRPTFSIGDVTVAEGNAGATNATFTVTLLSPGANTVSIAYATANSTATAGSDYTAANGTLTFAPGTTTQTITVPVSGDTVAEVDETFFVNLSNPSPGTAISDGQGVGTITNDDGAPPLPPPTSIVINDVTVTEGNAGAVNAVFLVTLSAPSAQPVTVEYATANGSASAASGDYVGTNGTLTFPAGTTSQSITVQVNGDRVDEADETFFVNLSNAANAAIVDGQGIGTIADDDASPTISINDVSQPEGNAGAANMTFRVRLSAPSEQTITVNYATADGTATTAGGDYSATNGMLTFAPGDTSQTIDVSVTGDTTDEPSETFTVNLSAATNATIADAMGTGTILNDDAPIPSLSINDVSEVEGNAGTKTFTFTVTLSAASAQTVTVNYQTQDITATAGSDYTAANGMLTFAPNETTKTIMVTVAGDTTAEFDERFAVGLSNATNAQILDPDGVGTIQNDDAPPTVSINDVTKAEGTGGTTVFTFTVTLAAASTLPATVHFQTGNGTANAGQDYATTQGTLVFASGETTKTINVTVIADALNEGDETFFVNLSNAVNATIGDGQGLGTITNDD